jgi:hypothetical protein
MKTKTAPRCRTEVLRDFNALGPVIEGSLCRIPRGEGQRWQLTDRPAGKTRTLYVPAARAEEVRRWTANWKAAKTLLAELSDASRGELRGNGGRAGGEPPRRRTTRASRPS